DNFFELGGDSILSIQIVSRAKQAGMKLTPRQLFENQTVGTLAAVADLGAGAEAADAEQGPVIGDVPLTAVQHWFFELEVPERSHFNMALMLDVEKRVQPEHLERALRELDAHHDALRLRFRRDGDRWAQRIAPVESATFVAVEDLAGASEDELATRAAAHQTALDLERGPLMRAVLFERGADRPQRLLWIVHHLAVDGVSWRILLEDLDRVLGQLERGEAVALPPKTTSFQRWAKLLGDHAAAPERHAEANEWAARLGTTAIERGAAGREAAARHVSVTLEAEETRALLTEVPKTYNTQINDILLTALVHAHATWSGEPSLLLNLEAHGREEIFDGVDLARTVGWFTTDYPVLLNDVFPFEPGAALRAVKEQLRAIPDQGLGFGVTRYLAPDAALVERLRSLPRPAVGFNYMGQFDRVFRDAGRFRYCSAPSGPEHDPAGERIFPLEVNGMVSGDRLAMDFVYSEGHHGREAIERLAGSFLDVLRGLVEHCLSPDAGGFTASDFSDFAWDDSELAAIASAIKRTQAKEGEK
ncbi:MAG: condensation domain-containing protein, partial [Planctomycetota bacterium]|nr:condensation domain-containing protein [Planctomycetota bacterium]